jgi:tRNA threonylcarbamoyladenosine biosynthesis protein TsaB
MKILALDTATENCSAALWIDGALREVLEETARDHASLILGMADRLLAEAQLTLGQLDAIAFGRGPGSFTGVRLAAAVTQGLAFAASLPVLPVSNLRALAARAFDALPAAEFAVCCADARMGEVYHGVFRRDLQPLGVEQVLAPSAVVWGLAADAQAIAIGRGFAAYPALLNMAPRGWCATLDQALPRAREVAVLAAEDYKSGLAVPPAAAQPVYLRNNVVTRP